MGRSVVRHLFSLLVLAATSGSLPRHAAAEVDFTGHWKTHDGPQGFSYTIDIVQSGTDATVCFPAAFPFGCPSATVQNGHLIVQTPDDLFIDVQLFGEYLDGFLTLGGPDIGRFFFQRCECDDGNENDGDGCDARCQVEPCFTCSGQPSMCTPRPDGAACEDGSPCTSGETCTAGSCGGGTAVSPCIDLSGRWYAHFYSASFDLAVDQHVDVRQEGSTLLFGYLQTFDPLRSTFLGTIDPLTGVFQAAQPSVTVICAFDHALTTISATASADAKTFAGTAEFPVSTATECFDPAAPWAVTGTRCGGGTLDPGEECDDGNIVDGDGCSANCQTEPVATPTPSPLCALAPRSGCRQAPNGVLVVRKGPRPDANALLWKWMHGEATAFADLGDPVNGATTYTLCVYGTSANQPSLAMQMIVPPGAARWTAREDGMHYRDASGAADGVAKLQVWTGASGAARAGVQGRGAALPIPSPASADSLLAVDPQVVVQLVNTDGSCWEGTYQAARSRARAALFKGRP